MDHLRFKKTIITVIAQQRVDEKHTKSLAEVLSMLSTASDKNSKAGQK